MGGGLSAGGQSGTSTVSRDLRFTRFPGEFVSDAGRVVGQPLTLDELLRGMPQTTGLFSGGSSVGGARSLRPGEGSATNPGVYGPTTVGATGTPGAVVPPDQRVGGDRGAANVGHTSKLARFFGNEAPVVGLPDAPSAYSPIDPASEAARFRIAPTTSDTGLGDFNRQGLFNTGIGAAPTTYAAPGSVNAGVPTITAPTAEAAKASLAAGDYNAYERGLFSSLYNPQANEINRAGAVQDRATQSSLAGAGLASSGAGIGTILKNQRDRSAQLQDIGQQAASEAVTGRVRLQSDELQKNTEREQETRLKNAGFSIDAQKVNVDNILKGNIANADNYLKTMNLNQDAAAEARTSFLKYLDISEQDLARMDKQKLDSLAAMLDIWVKQYGTLGQIGQQAVSDSVSSGGGGAQWGGSGGAGR